MPIGLQYPLVEAITGVVFVLIYRLLFIEQTRAGCECPALPANWALLLAWLVLAAVLIACSAMDIVSYMVDTGLTNFAVVAAILIYALSPVSGDWMVLSDQPMVAAAFATFLVSAFMLWWTVWRIPIQADSAQSTESGHHSIDESRLQQTPQPQQKHSLGVGVIFALAALTAWLMFEPHAIHNPIVISHDEPINPVSLFSAAIRNSGWSIAGTLIALFLVMVLSAAQERIADEELHTAIEQEAPLARREALREIAWLLPGIVAGALAYAAVALTPSGSSWWRYFSGFAPVAGALYAIHGAIIAAAAGWLVRIFFTLAFGKEAFGVGDIYILAAAGACGGCDIALLGFLFSVGVALLGFAIGLAMKRSSLIAFGPPLALGFLIALWLSRPSERVLGAFWSDARAIWGQQPWLLSGLLGGSVLLALVVAKLSRRLLERESQAGSG